MAGKIEQEPKAIWKMKIIMKKRHRKKINRKRVRIQMKNKKKILKNKLRKKKKILKTKLKKKKKNSLK